MSVVCTILFIAAVALGLVIREFPVMYGVLVPTGSIKRIYFKIITVAVVALAMFLPVTQHFAIRLSAPYSGIQPDSMLIAAFAAFVTVFTLDRLGLVASLSLAVLGALEGYRVFASADAGLDYALIGSWLAAPIAAMILGAVFYLLFKLIAGRSGIHFIKLSYHMRYAAIAGIALSALAIGINNGAIVESVGGLMFTGSVWRAVVPAAAVVASMIIFGRTVSCRTDIAADKHFDFPIQAVVVVSYAASITLLLFSWEGFCGVLGLRPSPVGVQSLVFGALLGIGLVQKRQTVETAVVYRSSFGIILSPAMAIIVGYLLSVLFNTRTLAPAEWFNYTIAILVVLFVVTMLFARYVRRQQQLKQATAKLLFTQQQQLYENQKALNDMELKTILAENQSLHGTLELKRKEIINVALGISEQKEFLESLNSIVKKAAKSTDAAEKERLIDEIQNRLGQRTSFSGQIDEFYTQAEILHKDFSVKLTEEFPNLTNQERRLATLLRLGFSSKYIATLMNISPKSVEISRYRLRQKLGLHQGDNLINFIKSI